MPLRRASFNIISQPNSHINSELLKENRKRLTEAFKYVSYHLPSLKKIQIRSAVQILEVHNKLKKTSHNLFIVASNPINVTLLLTLLQNIVVHTVLGRYMFKASSKDRLLNMYDCVNKP